MLASEGTAQGTAILKPNYLQQRLQTENVKTEKTCQIPAVGQVEKNLSCSICCQLPGTSLRGSMRLLHVRPCHLSAYAGEMPCNHVVLRSMIGIRRAQQQQGNDLRVAHRSSLQRRSETGRSILLTASDIARQLRSSLKQRSLPNIILRVGVGSGGEKPRDLLAIRGGSFKHSFTGRLTLPTRASKLPSCVASSNLRDKSSPPS